MPKYKIPLVKRTVVEVVIEADTELDAINLITPMLKPEIAYDVVRELDDEGTEEGYR